VGGVGFGAFIDELGKFITSANDYFFRPAVAVIYVVFVLVFLATRAISRSRSFSPQHALANAFDVAMQAGLSGLDRERRDQALELLEGCSPGPVRQHLEAIIRSMQVAPRIHFRPVRHILDLLDAFYERVAQTWWFSSIVVGFFAITAVTGISAVLVVVEWSWSLALWLGAGLVILVALAWSRRVRMRFLSIVVALGIAVSILIGWSVLVNLKAMPLSIVDIAQFVFPGISAVIIVAGVTILPRSRLRAYILFRLAILVSIFLTQVLSFYEQQFFALLGLMPNILILVALRYMIDHEHEKRLLRTFV